MNNMLLMKGLVIGTIGAALVVSSWIVLRPYSTQEARVTDSFTHTASSSELGFATTSTSTTQSTTTSEATTTAVDNTPPQEPSIAGLVRESLRFIPIEGCPQELYDPNFQITGPDSIAQHLNECRRYLTDGHSVYHNRGWDQLPQEILEKDLARLPTNPTAFKTWSRAQNLSYSPRARTADVFGDDGRTLFMNEKPLYDIDLSHLMIPGDKRLMDDDTMYVRGVRYDVDMNTYTRHGTEWDTDTTATDKFGLIINGVRVIGSPTDPIQYIDCNFAKDSKIVVEIKGDWGAYQVIEGADAQSFTVDEHCNPKDKFGEFDRFALVRKENLKCSSGIDEDGVAYTTCNTRPPYLQ